MPTITQEIEFLKSCYKVSAHGSMVHKDKSKLHQAEHAMACLEATIKRLEKIAEQETVSSVLPDRVPKD